MSKCKFCKENVKINSELSRGDIMPMLDLINFMAGKETNSGIIFDSEENLLGFDNSAGEYAMQYIHINYCPMCGRDLKEVNADECE